MFFSLTALGPASLGLPPARAATARMQRLASPMHAASLWSRAGRAGGREAAMPGTARLCGRVLCPPPLCPPRACSRLAAPPAACCWATLCPPGGPSPSGPRPPGLRSCWRPGCPATSSLPPLLTPPGCPRSAASLARRQAAWEPGPGWGTFLPGPVRRQLQQAAAGRGPGLGGARPRLPSSHPSFKGGLRNILFLIFSSRAAWLHANVREGRPKAPSRAPACEELWDHLSFALGTLTLPTNTQAAVRPCPP
ncbi:unnamed protein product [Rangifer tarandus platyrhynchus]|uniref:Uncharacterized protein n=1 Tax=Rangifer tarandus platyrhynchus TaxID=3082113 RepID=A0AC59Z7G6_RANTA